MTASHSGRSLFSKPNSADVVVGADKRIVSRRRGNGAVSRKGAERRQKSVCPAEVETGVPFAVVLDSRQSDGRMHVPGQKVFSTVLVCHDKGLVRHSKIVRSYALEKILSSGEVDFYRTSVFFRKSDYRILIYENDIQEFTTELRRRYLELQDTIRTGGAIPEVVSDDAATAFICHAMEDKKSAAELYGKLKAEGFRPWLDRENLRGGDDWDRHIRRSIKGIDYFLVLQSKALESKLIGYVHKEIRLAQERQRYFRPGIRFIIPLVLEPCERLEDLDYLQSIDLTTPEGIRDLVRCIRRDWQRRKKGKA